MQSFKMIFSGVTILQGVEFPIFPIDFAWALQQCSATALPVMREEGMTFGQLILRKIIKIVTTRRQILRLKCTNTDFGWGFAPHLAGRAYSALPHSVAGMKGPILTEGEGCREGDEMRG